MESLFTSEVGRKEILNLYDQKLSALQIQYTYKVVETSFGKTNIIITGKDTNPPILVIHGSNGCAPVALETYVHLNKKFQVFAIDVLAQPNKSANNRLSMKDNSYGTWINEVITKLEIQDVTMAGFSFGGLVILKTLLTNEKNIKQVFLSVPAYVVNGNPLRALFKIFIPMKRFMKTKKQKYIEKFLFEVFTERDEFAMQYLSKVFSHFKMDFTPVPVISKKEANTIQTPITIIAAKHDIIFPGVKMIKRAVQIFPSLKKTILLPDSKHVQSKSDNALIQDLILKS